MKEFWKDWRFWAIVIAVLLVIVAIILWFTCRPFCYATSGFLIGALGGFMGGFYVAKKKFMVQPKAGEPKKVAEAPKQNNAPRKPHW